VYFLAIFQTVAMRGSWRKGVEPQPFSQPDWLLPNPVKQHLAIFLKLLGVPGAETTIAAFP
jgi:hypothetical protein